MVINVNNKQTNKQKVKCSQGWKYDFPQEGHSLDAPMSDIAVLHISTRYVVLREKFKKRDSIPLDKYYYFT